MSEGESGLERAIITPLQLFRMLFDIDPLISDYQAVAMVYRETVAESVQLETLKKEFLK